uniref:Uncharacterized protein n=1 Tax=Salix viminalis TaxID=40686 RepID=A0A6N2N2T7_SALVM
MQSIRGIIQSGWHPTTEYTDSRVTGDRVKSASVVASFRSSVSILAEQTGAMGRKSPAKWIKTVLFGKRSSKSLIVKRREKTVNEKETLVSDRALEADLNSVPPVVTWTALPPLIS